MRCVASVCERCVCHASSGCAHCSARSWLWWLRANVVTVGVGGHVPRYSFRRTRGLGVGGGGIGFCTQKIQRTPLYQFHVDQGAKMVPFAGWEMPVQYKHGVLKEHMATRNAASIFDVSHMGQFRITGKDRLAFIESVTVADMAALQPNQARLSVLLNDKFGIIDDCVVHKRADHAYLVLNAGCKDKDMAHINAKLKVFQQKGGDCQIAEMSKHALVALQGPQAALLLQALTPKLQLDKLNFMFAEEADVAGIPCLVTRCGYTGEDGFEIAVPAESSTALCHKLLKDSRVLCAGLGARDSLRLEAGLCLYGHDLNEDISPIEAGLLWTITKRRREAGGFPGFSVFQAQMKNGVARKRVGLLTAAPAREHTKLVAADNTEVGECTSGTMSPCLSKGISMAYVATKYAEVGTELKAMVRGKAVQATVTKMPFVPNRYYKSK